MDASKDYNDYSTSEQKSLLERYGFENGDGAHLGDNRELFHLFHKTTIIRGTINEMVQDNNDGPLKVIKITLSNGRNEMKIN